MNKKRYFPIKRSKYVDDAKLMSLMEERYYQEAVNNYYAELCIQLRTKIPRQDYIQAKRDISIHIRNITGVEILNIAKSDINCMNKSEQESILLNAFGKYISPKIETLEVKNCNLYNNADNTLRNLYQIPNLNIGRSDLIILDCAIEDITPYFILFALKKELETKKFYRFSHLINNNIEHAMKLMGMQFKHESSKSKNKNEKEKENMSMSTESLYEKTGWNPNINVSPIIAFEPYGMEFFKINALNPAQEGGSKIEKITSNFIEKLEKWGIKDINILKNVTSGLSEILQNCYDHSSEESLSFAGCYMEREDDTKEIQMCIISYGNKGIGNNIIDKYTKQHEYLALAENSDFSYENLGTVLALQDRISSKNQDINRRGLGFMQFISDMGACSNNQFDFNIISYNTQICIKSTIENPFQVYGNVEDGRSNYLNENNQNDCLPNENIVKKP